VVKLIPERGRIFDVNGRVVADNKRVLVATIDRRIIADPQDRLEMFQRLSGPLNTPVERLYTRADDKRYDQLTEMPLAFDISEEQAAFLMERIEDYPGVVIKEDWRRIYPYGAVGSHVLGFLGAIQKDSVAYSFPGHGCQSTVPGRTLLRLLLPVSPLARSLPCASPPEAV